MAAAFHATRSASTVSSGRARDPDAPRSQPRRDRRPHLPHRRTARDGDGRRLGARRRGRPAHPRGRSTSSPSRPTSTRRRSSPRPRRASADAVHPGYGFLAESAALAEAVDGRRARLGRAAARRAALGRGQARGEAHRGRGRASRSCRDRRRRRSVGFPLIIKAAAGGGGRGMRVVRSPEELDEAIEAARREAKAALRGRHASSSSATSSGRGTWRSSCSRTTHGTGLASASVTAPIQRRHQKVVEESPSPAVDDGAAQRWARPPVALAQAVGYRSAGTAEFTGRGRRLLLPRAERPHPGRAPRDGARHRARPRRAAAPHRRRGAAAASRAATPKDTRSRPGSTPSIR